MMWLVFFVLCCTHVCTGFEECNANYLPGDHVPGKCVTFPECPTLFAIVKSRFKTIGEVKLLQRLTCKPDDENPTICCGIDEIYSETNNTDYAHKPSSISKQPDSEKIVFVSNDLNTENRILPKPKDEHHPNFRLLPSLTDCSKSVTSDRIVGGQPVSILDYPWMARIGYQSKVDDSITYLCGGTVINSRYILTAAHCTQEINTDELEPKVIRLAEKDVECNTDFGCSTPLDIEIERVIPHPNYSKQDKSNDIGLIRLKRDIPFGEGNNYLYVNPVCLPFVEEYGLQKKDLDPFLEEYVDNNKSDATVAGWGKTRWIQSEGSRQLMAVSLPVLSQQQCRKNYENYTRIVINDKQICAGGVKAKDSCSGDSGGGLFITELVPVLPKIKKPLKFQFGVVSFGPTHCGVGGLPGVYSNVYAYRSWILDQLQP